MVQAGTGGSRQNSHPDSVLIETLILLLTEESFMQFLQHEHPQTGAGMDKEGPSLPPGNVVKCFVH